MFISAPCFSVSGDVQHPPGYTWHLSQLGPQQATLWPPPGPRGSTKYPAVPSHTASRGGLQRAFAGGSAPCSWYCGSCPSVHHAVKGLSPTCWLRVLQWGEEIWAGTERLQRRGCSKHPALSFGMALGVWSASLHVVRSLYR